MDVITLGSESTLREFGTVLSGMEEGTFRLVAIREENALFFLIIPYTFSGFMVSTLTFFSGEGDLEVFSPLFMTRVRILLFFLDFRFLAISSQSQSINFLRLSLFYVTRLLQRILPVLYRRSDLKAYLFCHVRRAE